MVATLALAPSAHAGDPDTLWYGGIDAETGLAVEGGVWDFDDGTPQGWFSVDRTDEGVQVRHVTPDSHAVHGDPAVCSIDGGSIWFGSHIDGIAGDDCWPGGQGYGNEWVQSLTRSFEYAGTGSVTVTFDYFAEMDTDYPDLVYVYTVVEGERRGPHNADSCPDPDGLGYGGCGPGTPSSPAAEVLELSGGDLPSGPGSFEIEFALITNFGSSDDGTTFLVDTECGAFGVDNIHVSGDDLDHLSDFEGNGSPGSEWDGWAPSVAPPIGSLLSVIPAETLPDPPDPDCVDGQVMLAADPDLPYPHPIRQFESLRSNPIALVDLGDPRSEYDGVVADESSWFHTCDQEEPLTYGVRIQYHPFTCPATGVTGWSPPRGEDILSGGRLIECAQRIADLGEVVPPLAEVDSLRLVIEVAHPECISFFPCEQRTCADPYWDNLRVGFTRSTVAVEDPPPWTPGRTPMATRLRSAQPVRGPATLELSLDRIARVSVDVWAADGRRVRSLARERSHEQGVHTVTWDLTDGTGEAVASGVYFIGVRALGESRVHKLVVAGR
jgi:hypothetical protein